VRGSLEPISAADACSNRSGALTVCLLKCNNCLARVCVLCASLGLRFVLRSHPDESFLCYRDLLDPNTEKEQRTQIDNIQGDNEYFVPNCGPVQSCTAFGRCAWPNLFAQFAAMGLGTVSGSAAIPSSAASRTASERDCRLCRIESSIVCGVSAIPKVVFCVRAAARSLFLVCVACLPALSEHNIRGGLEIHRLSGSTILFCSLCSLFLLLSVCDVLVGSRGHWVVRPPASASMEELASEKAARGSELLRNAVSRRSGIHSNCY
jgi:hypothetical protein